MIIRLLVGRSNRRTKPTYKPASKPRVAPSTQAVERTSTPFTPVVVQETRVEVSIAAQIQPSTVTGRCYVIDGDTIQIGNVRLRLAGIDAPELDHPWGKAAKGTLMTLCKGHMVRAEISPELSYDRLVATCYLPDGRDLCAEMVRLGAALDWPKFSGGRYAHLEPEGIRKKHWKAAARQRGHMHVFEKKTNVTPKAVGSGDQC